MIDAPDRKDTRFPPEREGPVKKKIKLALQQEKKNYSLIRGIAGAACGGDILFQEACLELGIPSQVMLALPPEQFRQTSVSFAGKDWNCRYDKLLQRLPVRVLAKEETIDKNVWEAANETMLQEALTAGGDNLTLIALWNGRHGDGPGGTHHFIKVAKAQDAKVVIIAI